LAWSYHHSSPRRKRIINKKHSILRKNMRKVGNHTPNRWSNVRGGRENGDWSYSKVGSKSCHTLDSGVKNKLFRNLKIQKAGGSYKPDEIGEQENIENKKNL